MNRQIKLRLISADGDSKEVFIQVGNEPRVFLNSDTLGVETGLGIDFVHGSVVVFAVNPSTEFWHNGTAGIRFEAALGDWVDTGDLQFEFIEIPVIPDFQPTPQVASNPKNEDGDSESLPPESSATQVILRMDLKTKTPSEKSIPKRPSHVSQPDGQPEDPTQSLSPKWIPKFPASKWVYVSLLVVGLGYVGVIEFKKSTPSRTPASPEPEIVAPSPVAEIAPVAPMPKFPDLKQGQAAAQAPTVAPEKDVFQDTSMAKESFFDAVRSGDMSLVKKLVENRTVDPNLTLDQGMSALHVAAMKGHIQIAKYLISKRANVNARDPEGATPIMWAVFKKHPEMVKLLAKSRTDLTLRREDGDRAIDIAKRYSLKDLYSVLTPKDKSKSSAKDLRRHPASKKTRK